MSKAQKEQIAKKIEEALCIFRKGCPHGGRTTPKATEAMGYLKGINLVLHSFGYEYEEDNGGNVRIVKC